MLGILQYLTSFWARWRWLSTQLSWIFFSGINTTENNLRTLSIIRHCLWNAHEEVLTRRRNCLFLVKFFQWHRGGEREWYSNRIRLHPETGKKRKEALWTGSHNPERPISWWRSKERCARHKRRRGRVSRASAGGGSTWSGRGRGLWKRAREGRIGVVEEDVERRQARVPGRYSNSIRVYIVEPLKVWNPDPV